MHSYFRIKRNLQIHTHVSNAINTYVEYILHSSGVYMKLYVRKIQGDSMQ